MVENTTDSILVPSFMRKIWEATSLIRVFVMHYHYQCQKCSHYLVSPVSHVEIKLALGASLFHHLSKSKYYTIKPGGKIVFFRSIIFWFNIAIC